MLVCHGCHRHVRVEDPTCPFCGTSITTITAPSSGRLGSLALTAGLMLACTDKQGDSDGNTTTANSETMTTLGDGDGDPNETLENAASDYGGPEDFSSGDGDGDGTPCGDFGPVPAMVGANPVTVDAGSFLTASCGGVGPEAIYSFVAEVDGDYQFAVTNADFEATLYLAGVTCDPLDELACANAPDAITVSMFVGDTVYVVVDSSGAAGTASLDISVM
jgi:hypothetical protein